MHVSNGCCVCEGISTCDEVFLTRSFRFFHWDRQTTRLSEIRCNRGYGVSICASTAYCTSRLVSLPDSACVGLFNFLHFDSSLLFRFRFTLENCLSNWMACFPLKKPQSTLTSISFPNCMLIHWTEVKRLQPHKDQDGSRKNVVISRLAMVKLNIFEIFRFYSSQTCLIFRWFSTNLLWCLCKRRFVSRNLSIGNQDDRPKLAKTLLLFNIRLHENSLS